MTIWLHDLQNPDVCYCVLLNSKKDLGFFFCNSVTPFLPVVCCYFHLLPKISFMLKHLLKFSNFVSENYVYLHAL